MLLLLVVILVGSLIALAVVQRRRPMGRPHVTIFLGLDIALVGGLLTPGLGWGDLHDRSVRRPISTVIFSAGLGVVIWGAVLLRRTRRQVRHPRRGLTSTR